MPAEQPILTSIPSPVYTTISPLIVAALGIYMWLAAPYPSYYVGIVIIIYAAWLVYYSRRYSLAIYTDRLEIKHLFTKVPTTILFSEIRYCTEVRGRGSHAILLKVSRENFVFNAAMFSNYDEIKKQLIRSRPVSPPPTGWKFQVQRIIAYIFVALLLALMIYFRRR